MIREQRTVVGEVPVREEGVGVGALEKDYREIGPCPAVSVIARSSMMNCDPTRLTGGLLMDTRHREAEDIVSRSRVMKRNTPTRVRISD
jgi:hypothetical protein